ncbi:hypothetical protein A167_02735 [Alcanivorax sp. S71-1-4]|jgi:AsmA protein|uniref:AsmA family protein n=1 Tax=Alcanivorax sp. S71-1-4 TaxID=1177159 RepID=UPI00135728B6|nr:AsmA family protein [Alcanivorax sp. S71-1-4]KAF0808227.1 hypothetical protein A167_02735 [Alcanivorax sp. S71-1-4]
MARAARIALYTLIGLIVLLAVAVFVITRVIDPNDFKPQISDLARQHTNLNLDIQGDLAWTFWPSLGVSIGRTEARIGDDEDLFAAIGDARVGVAVWPLLFGNVEMDAISLSGLDLNLIENEQGGNWERIAASDTPAEETPAETEQGESSAMDIPLTIPEVTVADSRLRYRNTTDGTDIIIEHINVNASDVQLEEPFPVQASLRYQDQDDIRIDVNVDTVVGVNLDANHYTLTPLNVKTAIGGLTSTPVDIAAQLNVDAALDDDVVKVTDLVLEAAGTRTTGNVQVSGLSTQMQFSGKLATAPFDANAALRAIGEAPIETSDSNALKKIAFEADIGGPANSLLLDPLKITIDSSSITGKAGITDMDSMAMMFDLAMDQINLDGYLPPASEEEAPATAQGESSAPPALSEEPLLPLDTLRGLNIDGKLAIGKVLVEGLDASDIKVAMNARNGLLRLTEANGKTLNGSFTTSATLDARNATPTMSLNSRINTVQIQPLMKLALSDDLFTGIATIHTEMNTRGNSEKALMENAKGKVDFGLADGIVRGVNLHDAVIGGLNDMLGNFQALTAFIPNLESGKLPRELSEDTKIVDLKSIASLDNMVATVESLSANLDRGAALNGKGWLNILNEDFDITLGMKVPSISSDPRLSEREWPLRCAGNLNGSPARWCVPSSDAFRSAGRDLVTQLASDKLGVDLPQNREQLEQEVQERVQEEREKAEEKVRDRAREELQKLFR